jgi:uncharacterized membrane-anchored protein YitT (DUF2179 family)
MAYSIIQIDFEIHNQLICGSHLRHDRRTRGRDRPALPGFQRRPGCTGVLFYQKFNLGLGKFYFAFNAVLIYVQFFFLENDLVIASMIMLICTSLAMDYALSMFSQRKTVLIISDNPEKIVQMINSDLKMGATYINGTGTHSGKPKQIILTVINNIQLKRLEEIVFTIDETALFIAENSFSVIGSNLARRKIY